MIILGYLAYFRVDTFKNGKAILPLWNPQIMFNNKMIMIFDDNDN